MTNRLPHFAIRMFFLLVVLLTAPVWAAHPPAVAGTGGAVATAAPAATRAGIEILRAGGNAVDAAVAAALALAVVHPNAGNLGGGGFAVVRLDGEVHTLDFRETGPAGATPGMFLDDSGRAVAERSLIGPLAAGVPGTPQVCSSSTSGSGLCPGNSSFALRSRLPATVSSSPNDSLGRSQRAGIFSVVFPKRPQPGCRVDRRRLRVHECASRRWRAHCRHTPTAGPRPSPPVP